ncbi:MAG TPA: hypothetical protein VG982_03130 [Candidatus Paceibacterota bacterium]|nr:hypothetical protein [Candidatus Paceibacterota bacterium]
MKKSLIFTIGLIICVAFVIFVVKNKKQSTLVTPPQHIAMCYQYVKETSNGYQDRALLEMNILGENVTGEYRNLPAEKDSKVGTFTGTVGPMDPTIGGRIAHLWWNSLAEGMHMTEQLNIEFGEGSAVALFGEMVDRGDGTYVYKNENNLTPGFQMWQTDCASVQDMIIVEQYVRDNIKTIAPEKPVLGGSWYATTVYINPSTKTGTATYEDGHIQGKIRFGYTRNGEQVMINSVQPIQ